MPLFLAGGDEGQVIDAYKFFGGTGVNAYNLIASIGAFVLAIGILLTLVNAILSRDGGPEAGHDPGAATRSSGSRSRRRSRTTSTSCPTCAAPARCGTSARRSRTAPSAPSEPARESQPVA